MFSDKLPDECFTVYLLLFTVCFPPCGFGFTAPVEPTLSVKVVLNVSAGITVTAAFRFHLLRLFGSGKLCGPGH